MYMSSISIWCGESEYMSNMEDSKYMSILFVSNYMSSIWCSESEWIRRDVNL